MRRPKSVLSSSLAAIGLSATIVLAQQSSQAPSSKGSATTSATSVDPSMASRSTSHLLRNGLDYLAYHEYARALSFLKAVEARKSELNDSELQSLKRGIAQAQQGMREAVNSPKVVAQGKARATTQPGSFALAKAAKAPTDTVERTSIDLPPVQETRTSRTGPALPAPIALAAALPDPEPAPVVVTQAATPAQAPAPAAVTNPLPAPVEAIELPPLPGSPVSEIPASAGSAPSLPAQGPTVDPAALPTQSSSPVELPSASPPPPITLETTPTPVELPSVELPPVSNPTPVEPTSPPIPTPVDPAPRAMVAEAGQRPDSSLPPMPVTLPEPPPAREVPPAQEPATAPTPDVRSVPNMPAYPATPNPANLEDVPVLSERLRREVEEKYRRDVDQIAQRPGDPRAPGGGSVVDPNDPTGIPPVQGSPRLAIERAPSPTEARPLRRVPFPEEFTNLGKREWEPNRKYWAAAGTCHMTLYFQDPVLERYGQGVEQSLGPWGRYFSYPLDDPRQSNQRNQILQPFYSMGKFCFQVGTLPYKLVVDPPWESEYDLGYYRPGDRIPTDTIYITPTGLGPPLKGRNY